MNMFRFRSLGGPPGVSAGVDLSSLEDDLIRMACDPDRRVPFFVRLGLVLWMTERYHFY